MKAMKPENSIMKTLNHLQFLQVTAAGLGFGEYEFVGSALDQWLREFPGDLQASLMQSCFNYAQGKQKNALKTLSQIIALDPTFLAAYLSYYQLDPGNTKVVGAITALGGSVVDEKSIPAWAVAVRDLNLAVATGNEESAIAFLDALMAYSGEHVLVDLAHLQFAMKFQSPDAVLVLSRLYHERWAKCLQFKLVLADHAMRMGDEVFGLELLHDCSHQDLSGLSANWLWGRHHAYANLWPDSATMQMEFEIPYHLAASQGWNILQPGDMAAAGEKKNVDDQELLDQFTEHLANVDEVKEAPKHHEPDYTNEEVMSIFEQLSKAMGSKGLRNIEGRFPLYVVLTSQKAILKKYGTESTKVILDQMALLTNAVKQRPGWGAMIFMPDDEVSMKELGLTVRQGSDPWGIKLALEDLDNYLASKGSMIGAVVIAGGPDIIPYHQLPNPTDDADGTVPSDNPYASEDANYFIPEWPIGRFPDEDGADPGLLLLQIRRATRQHVSQNKAVKQSGGNASFAIDVLIAFFKQLFGTRISALKENSFGYSAAIWRRSSIAAYRPIGAANLVAVSPPTTTKTVDRVWLSEVEFAYYNLHGVEDGAEWFGQKDFIDSSSGPDYPVALQPSDISVTPRYSQVVFSEACYGGHIDKKTTDDSICLRYISTGCKGFVGSTCIAYGSVQPPLMGADLLGYLFWKHVQDGYSLGDALLRAKVEFATEMQNRQTFLDGEDQKTLISFVLFGDPLTVGIASDGKQGKRIERGKLSDQLMAVSENEAGSNEPIRLSQKTIEDVKQALSVYLPGLAEADFQVKQQYILDSDEFAAKLSMTPPEKLHRTQSGNVVMSFAKEIQYNHLRHRYYAKITVDANGKMIKLAVSR